MYFEDLSSDKHLGHIADGITESLINQLSDVNELDVVSQSGVEKFRGAQFNFDSVEAVLNAGILVRGTVSDEGDKLSEPEGIKKTKALLERVGTMLG